MSRVLVIGLALSAVTGLAQAQASYDCLKGPLAASTEVKQGLHRGLADLVAETAPDHAELAQLAADWQVGASELRHHRVRHLSAVEPARLPDANAVRSFAWDDEDEIVLAAKDPAYAALAEHVAALEAESRNHPGWSGLRAVVRERLSDTAEYKALLQDAGVKAGAVNADLAACFAG
ncbi:MAG: hypothetical protein AAGC57_05290 [Pseudomonadota bacterium]